MGLLSKALTKPTYVVCSERRAFGLPTTHLRFARSLGLTEDGGVHRLMMLDYVDDDDDDDDYDATCYMHRNILYLIRQPFWFLGECERQRDRQFPHTSPTLHPLGAKRHPPIANHQARTSRHQDPWASRAARGWAACLRADARVRGCV